MIKSAIALGNQKVIRVASVCKTDNMFPFWNTPVTTLPADSTSLELSSALNTSIANSVFIKGANVEEKQRKFLQAVDSNSFVYLERNNKLAIVSLFDDGVELCLQQPACEFAFGFVGDSSPSVFSERNVTTEIADQVLQFLNSPPKYHKVMA